MRQVERRIKRFISKRPGAVSTDISEYLGLNPDVVKRTLQSMKERGLIVGRVPNTNDVVGKIPNEEQEEVEQTI